MTHITFETLIDYAEDRLSAAQNQTIAAHLQICTDCQEELARARRILEGASENAWTAPATQLVDRVLSAFRRKTERAPQPATHPATLNIDSWTQLAALGIRGTPQERQFLFSEEAFDLDVQIVEEPSTQDYLLQGQLLSNNGPETDIEGIEVRLTDPVDSSIVDSSIADSSPAVRRVLTDHLGRFNFVSLPPGTYTLRLLLNDRDLLVETLPIETKPL